MDRYTPGDPGVIMVWLLASVAFAVPLQLNHQGRMMDSAGAPLGSTHSVTFNLYDSSLGGSPVWTETSNLDFEEGYFSAVLGLVTPLDDSLFDDGGLFIGLSVDGGTETPLQAVVSVPFAMRSLSAASVDTPTLGDLTCATDQLPLFDGTDWGCAAAASATVTWADVTGIPAGFADDVDDDVVGGLSCFADDVPMFTGTGWTCGDPRLTEAEVEGYITDGPIDLAVGSTVGGAAVVSGPIDWVDIQNRPAGLDDGDDDTIVSSLAWTSITGIPGDIADGDDVLTEAEVEAFVTDADIAFAGSVQVGMSSTCDSGGANDGSIRWNGALEVCDGGNWIAIGTVRDGSVQALAALSCDQLKTDFSSLPSGIYWVDPNGGATGDAFEVYCEMTTMGGGWTRIGTLDASIPVCSYENALGASDDVANSNGTAWLDMTTAQQFFSRGEVMLYSTGSLWNVYRSATGDPGWTWTNLATGAINPDNNATFGVEVSRQGAGFITSNNTSCGGVNGPCLLGGNDGTGWNMILGIGSYATGSFDQSSCSPASNSWRGFYSGVPAGNWANPGELYIR